jgi:hypothetical protein
MGAKLQLAGCPRADASQSKSDLLLEIDRMARTALVRVNDLRDRIRDSHDANVDDLSQLSQALDTLLHLKISKDILEQGMTQEGSYKCTNIS